MQDFIQTIDFIHQLEKRAGTGSPPDGATPFELSASAWMLHLRASKACIQIFSFATRPSPLSCPNEGGE